ncbi:unnamed protein product [Ambrosiozyma monospora]|uniref:Unnamed protein product n=1 Tax=Ambrosiozyma monospora TaxID=43982 RepID=A0ACB5T1Y9_AMBMO|nr:unnamed protein product [Ambrosiozyma monospora]
MSGLKVSFLRYLESQSLRRRDLMLQWCLDLSLTTNVYNKTEASQASLIPRLISQQKINLFKRNWNLLKRDFTTTQYFSNNFEAFIDTQEIIPATQEATEKLNDFTSKVNNYLTLGPGPFPQEIVQQKIETFDWFFKNRMFGLCFDLLKNDPYNPFIGFNKDYLSRFLTIIEKFGSEETFYMCVEHFGVDSVISFLPKFKNFHSEQISAMAGLFTLSQSLELGELSMSGSLRKETEEHLITIFSTSQISSYGKDRLASRLFFHQLMNPTFIFIQNSLDTFFALIWRIESKLYSRHWGTFSVPLLHLALYFSTN